MISFDLIVSNKGKREIVTDIYCDTKDAAMRAVNTLIGFEDAEYRGHVMFDAVDGEWVVSEQAGMDAVF